MEHVKISIVTDDHGEKMHQPKHSSSVRSCLKGGAHVNIRLSHQVDNSPSTQRRSSSKPVRPVAVTYQEDEKRDETMSDALTLTKNKFRSIIQLKTPKTQYSMREMENLLKEQAAQRKALEQQNNVTSQPLKMNIEDRYSDEGELDESRHQENNAVRLLDKWQLDNKKKKCKCASLILV